MIFKRRDQVCLTVTNTDTSLETIKNMVSSCHRNALRIIGPLRGESAGHRLIPQKASFMVFDLMLAQTNMFEQTTELQVIWDNMMLIMTSL